MTAEIEDLYPLSPMQQGMLFHSLQAPESGVYVEQMGCRLRGVLDLPAFERAWQRVVERHTILRTGFVWEEVDEPLQVVQSEAEVPLRQEDWRDASPAERDARLERLLAEERARGFELAEAPLMRLALLRTGETEHELVWTHHHLLIDGWSLPRLLQEVFQLYEGFHAGIELPLEEPRPYRDYIAWLQERDAAAAEAFWRAELHDLTAPTAFGIDNGLRESAAMPVYGSVHASLDAEANAAVQALARGHGLTAGTIVQAGWALLLSRYSRADDVVFGTTVSGRPPELPGAEQMIGLFINTLPVRVRTPGTATVAGWLRELQAHQVELRQFEYSPLVEVQGWSGVPRGTPLFESLVVFENYPVSEALQGDEDRRSLHIDRVTSFSKTNLPLLLEARPGAGLELTINYDVARFDAAAMERMLGHLVTLLGGMAARPTATLAELPMLTPAEYAQAVVGWNDTDAPYPADRCLHELVEAQVTVRPEATAVSLGRETLTYAELNRRANRLAHRLRDLGVGPGRLVGLATERSLDLVVGLLGILKAGGAYLPLDPRYPAERLAYMLSDAQVGVLVTQCAAADELPPHAAAVVLIEDAIAAGSPEADANPSSLASPDDLAYVIYTSGSTGKPKGVLLAHRGACNLATAHIDAFRITPESRKLQFASFSFDSAVSEIFTALVSGAQLVLAPQERLTDADSVAALLAEEAISVAVLPPALLAVLPDVELPALRTLVSAADACPWPVAQRWAAGRRFLNGYGPTEATVGPVLYVVGDEHPRTESVPIGRPIANMRAYVLDQNLQPLPIGVPGEICLAGVGLAHGYLDRAELTAEKFVTDPFAGAGRVYRTGDLARRLPDGNLEFVGRIDHQVKIRGYRVELGEIEHSLREHPAVRDAAVIVRRDPAADRLVAYLVLGDASAREADWRGYLRERLPEHMVPAAFIALDELPLTPNGKVDRAALPVPALDGGAGAAGYIAPRTPAQELIAGIWAEVLGVDRVGLGDDFFDLGGHSLLVTRLVSRLREAFQVELPITALFEAPTVAGLAERVELARADGGATASAPIVPAPRDGVLPLSFAQQRLWFLDQLEPDSPFYNNPAAIRLRGVLDAAVLQRTLGEIVRRHESLRTSFDSAGGQPIQVIAASLDVPLPLADLAHLPDSEREDEVRRQAVAEARTPFDLRRDPLLRARLIRLADDEHVILLTLHHIVSDGWSMGVLVREIGALYRAFAADEPSPLPDLPIQYADFAHWQRSWLQGEVLERQVDYWKRELGGAPTLLELPTDRPRPPVQTHRGASVAFTLPPELSRELVALSRREGATLFMTLLAAWQTLLHRYSGQNDILVGTPIANRTRAETEGLIGFFVNTLVLRGDLSEDPSFRDLLGRVRTAALGAYAHQDLPFEQLVDALQPSRDLSHTPLFQAMFVLDNAPIGPMQLPGITLEPLEAESGTARFDLTLSMIESAGGIGASLEYNTDLFDATTIDRLIEHFRRLLAGIVADPERRVSALPLLDEAERRRLLVEWNDTAAPFAQDRLMQQLFEERAAAQPEAAALIFEGASVSYGELDRRANRLARYLQAAGVGPDTIVGLGLERSIETITAILGVLKAGGAYLPLDPAYPADRLAFMMADAELPVLVTTSAHATRLPGGARRTILLDVEAEAIAALPATAPECRATPTSLAYVIYTSGSTGQPKGVLLEHRGVANLAAAQQRAFGVGPGKRVLQFAPSSFDASVWETVMALASGATLVLARQETLASGAELLALLRDGAVTTVTLPPSLLAVLAPDELPALETVIAAGEACSAELVARWAPGRRFFNAYGPTESTVCASMKQCSEHDAGAPTIGRPLPNVRLYVLDRVGEPVPVGVAGELYIGGAALARGYHRRAELTAERFVGDRFGDRAGRLYRTGDLVRWRADGELEFLGRIDHQVKLRGFRIELGEVEAAMRRHPDVADALVVAREDGAGGPRLVGYLVSAADTPEDLRDLLRQSLPDYMVPSAFVRLEAWPLTPSGKIDRRALPAPDASRRDSAAEYVAPRTPEEERLAGICAELLGLERVGVRDNFFEIGGHSLLATQLLSRIRDAFEVELPLRSLFELPTVEGLAQAIATRRAAGPDTMAPAIRPVAREARRVKRSAL